jgi:hypothetical protein
MINFPIAPTLNQQYTEADRTWKCVKITPDAVWDIVPISTSDAETASEAAISALASKDAAAISEENAEVAYQGSQDIWEDLQVILADGPVISVNGETGTVLIEKADIGLSNVDNLSRVQILDSPAITGTPTGITKTHVGLPNVDNTADIDKPLRTVDVWERIADVVPTAVSTITISLPSTHRLFRIYGIGLVPATGTAFNDLYTRVRIGGVLQSGASDYFNQRIVFFGTSVLSDGGLSDVLAVTTGGNNTPAEKTEFEMSLYPGDTGKRGSSLVHSRGLRFDGTRQGFIASNEILPGGRIDGIQLGWISGTNFTATGRIVVEGLRA